MKRWYLMMGLAVACVAFILLMVMVRGLLANYESIPTTQHDVLHKGTSGTLKPERRVGTNIFTVSFKVYRPGQRQSIEVHDGLEHVNLVKGDKYSREVNKACDEGALAAVTLKVVDEVGDAVADVDVRGGFWNNGAKGHGFNTKTDHDGFVQLSDTCYADMHCELEKAGYYQTALIYNFFQAGFDCARGGRWIPWNPTVEVVIKRIRRPVAMYVRDQGEGTALPLVGVPMGYDLSVGDLVAPYGRGKTRDFDVTFFRDGTNRFWTSLELVLSNQDSYAGFYKVPCDSYSVFRSPYHADTNDVYQHEVCFTFRHPGGKGRYVDGTMRATDCLVLRTRTRSDAQGRLVGAHYGKIYGPLDFGLSDKSPGTMNIRHYFNPNENDSNLECCRTNNLMKTTDRDHGCRP